MITVDQYNNHIIDSDAFKNAFKQCTDLVIRYKDCRSFLSLTGKEFLDSVETGKFMKSYHFFDNRLVIEYRD